MRGSGLMSGTIFPALVVAMMLVIVGCTAAPIQEMSDARQALQAAKVAGVDAADSQLLKLAEDRLKSAELKLKRHWYQSAREDALLARDAAVKARMDSASAE